MSTKSERIKKSKAPAVDPILEDRLPPGQTLTERFPILHEGEVPQYDLKKWRLRVFGEVEEEKNFSYKELMALPQNKVVCDIHCVTRWSKFDSEWEGICFRDFLNHIKVKPEAKFVMIHGDFDFEANVPLDVLMDKDVLLALKYAGEELTEKHGWPLRLLIPKLYFWKSVKWVTGIEFMKEDRLGFWERNGFNNHADPFKEERFSGEDLPIPEDEWERKEFD